MELLTASQFLKFIAALVFVLALMGGLALILKKINMSRFQNGISSKRRLKIKEILPIDAKRRLALIQRDNTEHLVILSANGDTVIESGITEIIEETKE
jgi:flagellar protein FliO/FliZ